MSTRYEVVRPSRRESESVSRLPTEGTYHDLTEPLEAENLRVRTWYFEPGERSTLHKHDEQEELYVLLDGPAGMIIGDDRKTIDISEGEVVRVRPDVPRQLLNDTNDRTVWLIVGAPPVLEGNVWDDDRKEYVPVDEWFS